MKKFRIDTPVPHTMNGLRAVLIVNPKSGSRVDPGQNRAAAVLEVLRAAAWEAEFVHASNGVSISIAARRAIEHGADVVIAAGGDGTISAVASVVAGTRAALGVIPFGTLNHFARDLHIPEDPVSAARVVIAGNIKNVDIGEVNGRRFINNSSLGLYPSIVRFRESRERSGWSRLLAFVAGTLLVMRRYRFLRLHMEIDGTIHDRVSPFLVVANNRYEIEGLRLGQRTRLDGGSFALYLSDRTGRLGLLRIALSALLKRLRLNRDFVILSAHTLMVQAHRKRIQVALDGEVTKLHPPLRYVIRPGLLKVICPA
jgi:diacylglycerol kinase family enzyme